MSLPEYSETMSVDNIQQYLVLHIARLEKVVAYASRSMLAEHFTWAPANVVIQAVFKYYDKYGRLPTFSILKQEAVQIVKTPGESFIHETEYGYLQALLADVQTTPTEELDAAWAIDEIKKYLTKIQLSDLNQMTTMAIQTGSGVEDVVDKARSLTMHIGSDDDEVPVASMLDSSLFDTEETYSSKINTGLTKMDAAIGGGMAESELCLLAALQGVGKTNMMLNFMVAAAYDGWYNLLLSLEMPMRSIQERVLAMTALIPAIKFRESSISDFTEYERRRIRQVQETDLANKLVVSDYSGRVCTMEDIIAYIGRWLKMLENKGVRDKAGVVCIDYVNFIEVLGLKGDRTNLSPDVIKRTIDRLKKEVANAYGLRVYIASQTTSGAEGNKVLSRSHVAWGFHANDAIDFGFGLAPAKDERLDAMKKDPGVGGIEVEGATKKGRQLVLSSFKARAGDVTAFNFYQAPTLRVYDHEGEYTDLMRSVEAGEFNPVLMKGDQ